MKLFDFQDELRKIAESKQLVETYLNGVPVKIYTYIISANEEYITLAVVNAHGTLDGVTMCRMEDIEAISIDTEQTRELTKVTSDSVHRQALKEVEDVKEFTFEGFAESLQRTKMLVEVKLDNDDSYSGRITGLSQDFMAMDEFASNINERVSHSYFPLGGIARMSVGVAWLKATIRHVAEKNL